MCPPLPAWQSSPACTQRHRYYSIVLSYTETFCVIPRLLQWDLTFISGNRDCTKEDEYSTEKQSCQAGEFTLEKQPGIQFHYFLHSVTERQTGKVNYRGIVCSGVFRRMCGLHSKGKWRWKAHFPLLLWFLLPAAAPVTGEHHPPRFLSLIQVFNVKGHHVVWRDLSVSVENHR